MAYRFVKIWLPIVPWTATQAQFLYSNNQYTIWRSAQTRIVKQIVQTVKEYRLHLKKKRL